MKIKKIFFTILFFCLFMKNAQAAGTGIILDKPQALTGVAGINSEGELVGFLLSNEGALQVEQSVSASTLVNFEVSIEDDAGTDRVQLPSNSGLKSCTIQAFESNNGKIYVGGSTVTNSSGSNEGIVLEAGDSVSSISVTNSNQIYLATDVANDSVRVLCL